MIALALVPRFASAAWPHGPSTNLPVCTAANDQQGPAIVSDGAGGAIVAWHDRRSGVDLDIYAQHVLPSGSVDPAWPADGRALCTAAGDQQIPTIVADGTGGAIVTWNDSRGGTFTDVYAQHVLASGAVDPAWPADGRALCTATNSQNWPTIATDGAGGAIITWHDMRNGTHWDIYAQRVLASGAVDPAWPANGRALYTAAGWQYYPTIVADGTGGAIVTWNDLRSGGSNWDVYAQHVLASGAVDPAWPANGRAICTAAEWQAYPKIASDGAGGAIVVWRDGRSAIGWDIYAQRVLASGAVDPAWPVDGRALCTATDTQIDPAIVSEGSGGAIVAWSDYRSGLGFADTYAQRVLAGGTVDPAWPADGQALCTAANDQQYPAIVSDGAGGAIVAWQDFRSGTNNDVYAQRVLASGLVDPAWPAGGRALCTAAGDQQTPAIVSDGASGAVVVWQDFRGGANSDIYAQGVASSGSIGNPAPVITGVRDVPNDQGGKVKVSWSTSYLDLEADPNLTAYDIYRSVPSGVAVAAIEKGALRLSRFGEVPPAQARAFYLGLAAAADYAWEYLATQLATHAFAGYSLVASTTSDSLPGSNPRTAFVILARNASGSMFWLSTPDSGYSVDNFAPVAPTGFAGQYAAGSATLYWNPNAESDLAGYRVYRGHSPSFVPGTANLVAALAGTGYVDAAGEPAYYKLSAVDIHGNESPHAFLLPGGTVGVEDPALAREVSFARPAPNPARDGVAFAFSLPREARVELALFDPAGRLVRTLVSATRPAGEHASRWDLSDEAGRPVRAGLYLARLEVEGRRLVRRLAVTR